MKIWILLLSAVCSMQSDENENIPACEINAGKDQRIEKPSVVYLNTANLIAISSYSSLVYIIYYLFQGSRLKSEPISIPMGIASSAYLAMMTVFFFKTNKKFQNEKLFIASIPVFSIICFKGVDHNDHIRMGMLIETLLKIFTKEMIGGFIAPVLEEIFKFTIAAGAIKIMNFAQRDEKLKKYAKEIAIVVGGTFDISETFSYVGMFSKYKDLMRIFPAHTLLCLAPFYFFQRKKNSFWNNSSYGLMYSIAIHMLNNITCLIIDYLGIADNVLLIGLLSWTLLYLFLYYIPSSIHLILKSAKYYKHLILV